MHLSDRWCIGSNAALLCAAPEQALQERSGSWLRVHCCLTRRARRRGAHGWVQGLACFFLSFSAPYIIEVCYTAQPCSTSPGRRWLSQRTLAEGRWAFLAACRASGLPGALESQYEARS